MSYETDALDPAKWLKMQKGLRDIGSLGPDVLAMRHVERLLTEADRYRNAVDDCARIFLAQVYTEEGVEIWWEQSPEDPIERLWAAYALGEMIAT